MIIMNTCWQSDRLEKNSLPGNQKLTQKNDKKEQSEREGSPWQTLLCSI